VVGAEKKVMSRDRLQQGRREKKKGGTGQSTRPSEMGRPILGAWESSRVQSFQGKKKEETPAPFRKENGPSQEEVEKTPVGPASCSEGGGGKGGKTLSKRRKEKRLKGGRIQVTRRLMSVPTQKRKKGREKGKRCREPALGSKENFADENKCPII